MKKLKCSDLVPGCSFEATGDSEEEVLRKAANHAQNDHKLEVTIELADKVRAAIRDD